MNGDTWATLSAELEGRMNPDTWEASAETAREMAAAATQPGERLYWEDVEVVCKLNAARIRDIA